MVSKDFENVIIGQITIFSILSMPLWSKKDIKCGTLVIFVNLRTVLIWRF